MRRFLQRLLMMIYHHVHWWDWEELESEDGALVYTVRTCSGCGARQVLGNFGYTWTDVTTAQFSTLPMFEEWHREQFRRARPRALKSKLANRNSKIP